MDFHFEDFTEEGYRALLRQVKEAWPIGLFPDYQKSGRLALWRHDIDMSVHRSYRLAEIEKEEGVQATYFIHLHNQFYHVWEKTNFPLLEKICDMGHELALHFVPDFYDLKRGQETLLEEKCAQERRFIEEMFGVEVRTLSFHNPDLGGWHQYEVETIAGMVNTYSATFKRDFAYCSDSNGYWRFKRMSEFLEERDQEKIHLLTHPAWWVPEATQPRERVSRCIEGRSRWTHNFYDGILETGARVNVGKE